MTGEFDDWGRTVKLEKKDGNRFEKLVDLPQAEEKVSYKVRALSRTRCCSSLARTIGAFDRRALARSRRPSRVLRVAHCSLLRALVLSRISS